MTDASVARTAIRPEHFPWFDYSRYTFSLGLDLGTAAVLSGHSASEYGTEERRIIVRGGMREQTRTAYAKISAILQTAGYTLGNVVRIVEYVTSRGIADAHAAADVRREVFGEHAPAVNTVCVNRLLRPEALIEIEVVAVREGLPNGTASAIDGIVYLASILPVDDGGSPLAEDVVGQVAACYDLLARRLDDVGLSMAAVTKIVDYITPAALADYKVTGRVRRERLGRIYPGSTGIIMERLAHPQAQIQLDVMASHLPLEVVNPGWGRYDKLTYSPAVRAGNVLFMSGQAALDPETERAVHAGDIVAQADYTYRNILRVVEAAGGGPDSLVKSVEYVTPAGLPAYRGTSAVRGRLFTQPYPVSTGILCEALLRPEFLIEVDPFAVLAPS